MALTAGTKPTSYSSVLTGLSKEIYDSRKGISIPSESPITTTIGDETFTESDSDKQKRIFNAKLDSWCIAEGIIKNLKSDGEVKTQLTSTLIETFAGGVGTNGGSLVAAQYPVVGTINLPISTIIAKIN